MKKDRTPRQRAESLLQIHSGKCFVTDINVLASEFRKMESEGIAVITPCHYGNIHGINVESKALEK